MSEEPRKEPQPELEFHQLIARKGYTVATLNMLLYEFIKSRNLFPDLIAFLRRWK